ncbi:MAG: hypothetical protein ACR2RF_32340 [Geminicoccaceae bacterium]
MPLDWYDEGEHRRKLADAINLLAQGKLLSTGEVTLTASSATTTLTDDRIGTNSFIGFMPTTANAATEIATLFVTNRDKGTATLNHANNAQTDRDFVYCIIG